MNEHEESRGTLKFTIWGIPVVILPSSWIVLALLGGAFGISDGSDLKRVLIFVAGGMLCVLAHELGHALAGRYYTGTTPRITIAMMGGLTSLPIPPRTRAQYFLYVLAGPLAGLLPGLLVALLLGIQVGNIATGLGFMLLSPFGLEQAIPEAQLISLVRAITEGSLSLTALQVYSTIILISVWWSIFNLLPILPLDGGHLLETATNNTKLAALTGVLLAGTLALLSATNAMWFSMMLLGYFAYINWQIFKSLPGSSR